MNLQASYQLCSLLRELHEVPLPHALLWTGFAKMRVIFFASMTIPSRDLKLPTLTLIFMILNSSEPAFSLEPMVN
jgi:hypothetical protein